VPARNAAGLDVGSESKDRRATVAIFAFLSLALYALALASLRALYPPQWLIRPYGHHPGWDLLEFNLTRWRTWRNLLVTLHALPLLSILSYRAWPSTLKAVLWSVVPAWVVVHFIGAIAAETRLFLVPAAIVLIPGALFWVRERGRDLHLGSPCRPSGR
jgi:hypothetical protein